ncbi:hypothetical protein AB595_02925 [Massilia sp. WF1]|nr:hypothetical protein AM586_10800 [Massilia sp. WG5]KLU38031.1 hypothetical protein AB595_02925 [Massilia sp. WF1]
MAAPGNGGAGVTAGMDTGADTAAGKVTGGGASTTCKGPPEPARSPGMPNCSDRRRACSSSDTSKPPASRRLDGASFDGARRASAGIAVSVDMLMAAGNIV